MVRHGTVEYVEAQMPSNDNITYIKARLDEPCSRVLMYLPMEFVVSNTPTACTPSHTHVETQIYTHSYLGILFKTTPHK